MPLLTEDALFKANVRAELAFQSEPVDTEEDAAAFNAALMAVLAALAAGGQRAARSAAAKQNLAGNFRYELEQRLERQLSRILAEPARISLEAEAVDGYSYKEAVEAFKSASQRRLRSFIGAAWPLLQRGLTGGRIVQKYRRDYRRAYARAIRQLAKRAREQAYDVLDQKISRTQKESQAARLMLLDKEAQKAPRMAEAAPKRPAPTLDKIAAAAAALKLVRQPKGWLSVAVLDSRTTAQCATLHNAFYPYGKSYGKYKQAGAIPDPPPRHTNCRSSLVTLWENHDLKRARDWDLAAALRGDAAFADDILGPQLAALFLKHPSLTIRDIYSNGGVNRLTWKSIADIKAKTGLS